MAKKVKKVSSKKTTTTSKLKPFYLVAKTGKTGSTNASDYVKVDTVGSLNSKKTQKNLASTIKANPQGGGSSNLSQVKTPQEDTGVSDYSTGKILGQYKGQNIYEGSDQDVQNQVQNINQGQPLGGGIPEDYYSTGEANTPPLYQSQAQPIDYGNIASIGAENITSVQSQFSPSIPTPYATEMAVNNIASRQPYPIQPVSTETPLTAKQQLLQRYLPKSQDEIEKQKEKIRRQADLQDKLEEANRLQNLLKTTKRDYEDKIEQIMKNPEGKFGGAIQIEADDMRRAANKELADIAIQAEFASDNYLGAEKIVNSQIADIQQSFENQVRLYSLAADYLENDLTESERIMLENDLDEKRQQKDLDIYKLKAEFEQQLQQKDPIYALRLKQAQADLNLTNARIAGEYQSQAGRSGGGVDRAGNIIPASPEQLLPIKDRITDVDSLISSKALSKAVGTNVFGRFNPTELFTGAKSNFIASIEQLTGRLTVSNLQNAKQQGATFGALSDSELRLLQNSATKINKWAIKNKKGTVTGYSANENDFKGELGKILNFAKRDYLLKGGDPLDVGAIQTPDGAIWVKNYDGTLTQLN